MKPNRGYTLLEILLSLMVVATLALVFIGVTKKIQQKNQIRTAALQMNTITNAAVNYYQMYNDWPTTFTPLNTLANATLSCSPWKNGSSCANYLIASTATSKYFAVTVTTPSTSIATRLAAQLPTAYSSGTTVTAYATTFPGLPAPTPPHGVLLAATSTQYAGACNTTVGTTTYANPFNCLTASTTPNGYGLPDLYNQPKNTIVSQNVGTVIGNKVGYMGNFTDTSDPICPKGWSKTKINMLVGIRTPIALTTIPPTATEIESAASYSLQSTGWEMNYNSLVGSTYNSNISAGIGDLLCLPSDAYLGAGWKP